jgi:hypothetical protein
MTRYMTAYFLLEDKVEAFTEDEDWKKAQEEAEDFVWQFAPDKETAIFLHFEKLDDWENNPDKETY